MTEPDLQEIDACQGDEATSTPSPGQTIEDHNRMAEALARAVVVPEHTLNDYPELAEQIRSNTADPTNTMVQSTSRRPRPPATDDMKAMRAWLDSEDPVESYSSGRHPLRPILNYLDAVKEQDND